MTMTLLVSAAVDQAVWDETVRGLGGTILHASVWAAYITACSPNATPRFIKLSSQDGEIRGVALAFLVSSRYPFLRPLLKQLRLNAPPVVRGNDENILVEFLGRLEEYARSVGAVELFVDGGCGALGALRRSGFDLTERLEFEVDLTNSVEDLWKGIEHAKRKNINKATRMGVTIHELVGEEGLKHLRRLQQASSTRIVERGGPSIVPRSNYVRDPASVLAESPFGRIVAAQAGEDFVSAVLYTSFNGLVYPIVAGHDQSGFGAQAGTLLHWDSIVRYKNEGAQRYSLGGCKLSALDSTSPEHGLYKYKSQFGTSGIEGANGQKVLRRILHRAKTFIQGFRQ